MFHGDMNKLIEKTSHFDKDERYVSLINYIVN